MANRHAREEGEVFVLLVCTSIILVFIIIALFGGTSPSSTDLEILKNNSEAVNLTVTMLG